MVVDRAMAGITQMLLGTIVKVPGGGGCTINCRQEVEDAMAFVSHYTCTQLQH